MSGSGLPRVIMVVRLFHPWVGGTERQAHKLSLELIRRGIDVQIVTGWWFKGTPQAESIDGVPVFRNHTLWEFFGIRGLRKLGGYLYIITLIWRLWRQRTTFDIIHVHGLNYHTFAAVLAGRLLDRRVVVKLANSGPASDILRMRRGQQLALSRLMLPTALKSDRFVALNRAVVSELQSAGVPHDRIVEIPNGVELDSEAADPCLHDPPRIVFAGRLHQQKGVDLIVQAMALLQSGEGSLTVELRLVGDGPDRERLRALAEELGVSDRVRFLGIREDVTTELRRADLFVLTSKAEGLSNALLEAMALGLPVVASNVPGNSDVIIDGRNGLLVDPDRPEKLAQVLRRVLQDPALRARLGGEARNTVERHYAITDTAERYIALYHGLIPGSQGSAASTRRLGEGLS